jgi:4-amino-4-deoxy-L-arabinose transferase-like glycosyltransferase
VNTVRPETPPIAALAPVGSETGARAGIVPAARRTAMWRVLAAAACVGMLLGTPLPHVDSDAALFGKIARHIVDSGDWLTLRHPVHPDWVVDKPPLDFWIMAISFRLAGQSDATLRLWHILLSIVLVFVVYKIARIDAGEEDGLLAAVVFASMQQVFYASMAPQHDVPVTLFLALAFYAYLRYRGDGRGWRAVLAGVWMAAAVLAKGILWLPVFVGIAAADATIAWQRGDRPPWRFRHLALGAVVFIVLAAPWFVIGALRQGAPFVHVFLVGGDSIARLRRSYLGGGGLIALRGFVPLALAYIPLLMVGMLPWTGLLPGAAGEGWRALTQGAPAARLCAVWFGLFFLVVSLSQGDRIIRYLLPCYPPLAVLAGRFLGASVRSRTRMLPAALISLIVGLPMMVAAAVLAQRASPYEMRFYTPMIVPVLFVFALAILAFAALVAWRRLPQAIAVVTVGSLLSYTVAYAMIMAHWERLWPWPAVGATVNRLYRPGDRVMVVGVNPAETNFAAYWVRARVEQVDVDTFLQAWRRRRVFALLSPDLWARVGERLRPVVLVQTPLGWRLVTNR